MVIFLSQTGTFLCAVHVCTGIKMLMLISVLLLTVLSGLLAVVYLMLML